MPGDTLLLLGTPGHRFAFVEAFLGCSASRFPAMNPKLRFYECGEAASTRPAFRGSRNEGTSPASEQRTSRRGWSRLNLGQPEDLPGGQGAMRGAESHPRLSKDRLAT